MHLVVCRRPSSCCREEEYNDGVDCADIHPSVVVRLRRVCMKKVCMSVCMHAVYIDPQTAVPTTGVPTTAPTTYYHCLFRRLTCLLLARRNIAKSNQRHIDISRYSHRHTTGARAEKVSPEYKELRWACACVCKSLGEEQEESDNSIYLTQRRTRRGFSLLPHAVNWEEGKIFTKPPANASHMMRCY